MPDRIGHDNPKKEEMIKALEKALGVVTIAAKEAGIARSTHYEWLESDPNYKQAVDDLQNVVLDFAEAKLHKMVEKEDTAATIFLLKTKGKKRGYVERQEISPVDTDGNNLPTIQVNVIRPVEKESEGL